MDHQEAEGARLTPSQSRRVKLVGLMTSRLVEQVGINGKSVALALSELVEEGWLSLSDAMDLIDPIMHANARAIFNLAEKTRILNDVKWT